MTCRAAKGEFRAAVPARAQALAPCQIRSDPGNPLALMARSGSLSPCPVNTHTTLEPAGTPCLINPATDAEDAASQNTDSSAARKV